MINISKTEDIHKFLVVLIANRKHCNRCYDLRHHIAAFSVVFLCLFSTMAVARATTVVAQYSMGGLRNIANSTGADAYEPPTGVVAADDHLTSVLQRITLFVTAVSYTHLTLPTICSV